MESKWLTTHVKVIREDKHFLCKRYEMRLIESKQILSSKVIHVDYKHVQIFFTRCTV